MPSPEVYSPTEVQRVLPVLPAKTEKTQDSSNQGELPKGVDPLELAYLMIFHSEELCQDTAQIQSKGVQQNANVQNKMINLEAQFSFSTLSPEQLLQGVTTDILSNLEAQNQEVSAVRGVIEDQINVLKQNASVQETNLNSTADESQQSTSQGSSLMQMLTSLTSQISRI